MCSRKTPKERTVDVATTYHQQCSEKCSPPHRPRNRRSGTLRQLLGQSPEKSCNDSHVSAAELGQDLTCLPTSAAEKLRLLNFCSGEQCLGNCGGNSERLSRGRCGGEHCLRNVRVFRRTFAALPGSSKLRVFGILSSSSLSTRHKPSSTTPSEGSLMGGDVCVAISTISGWAHHDGMWPRARRTQTGPNSLVGGIG